MFGRPSSAAGEARAALEGIRLAMHQQWTAIKLEGDSLRILSALQNPEDRTHLQFGALLEEIISLLESFIFVV